MKLVPLTLQLRLTKTIVVECKPGYLCGDAKLKININIAKRSLNNLKFVQNFWA